MGAKNKIIGGLLAMLGFSGCDTFSSSDMYGPVRVEYGTPYAEFTVKGKVSDEKALRYRAYGWCSSHTPIPMNITTHSAPT